MSTASGHHAASQLHASHVLVGLSAHGELCCVQVFCDHAALAVEGFWVLVKSTRVNWVMVWLHDVPVLHVRADIVVLGQVSVGVGAELGGTVAVREDALGVAPVLKSTLDSCWRQLGTNQWIGVIVSDCARHWLGGLTASHGRGTAHLDQVGLTLGAAEVHEIVVSAVEVDVRHTARVEVLGVRGQMLLQVSLVSVLLCILLTSRSRSIWPNDSLHILPSLLLHWAEYEGSH